MVVHDNSLASVKIFVNGEVLENIRACVHGNGFQYWIGLCTSHRAFIRNQVYKNDSIFRIARGKT